MLRALALTGWGRRKGEKVWLDMAESITSILIRN
jgi:hypothetical protein